MNNLALETLQSEDIRMVSGQLSDRLLINFIAFTLAGVVEPEC